MRRVLPAHVRRWLKAHVPRRLKALWQPQYRTPMFGSLRRVTPLSREFGFDRGQPIERYYIENFLARQADDIRRRVLEIRENFYTQRYGGGGVKTSNVLDVVEDNPQATIVADLTLYTFILQGQHDHIGSGAKEVAWSLNE